MTVRTAYTTRAEQIDALPLQGRMAAARGGTHKQKVIHERPIPPQGLRPHARTVAHQILAADFWYQPLQGSHECLFAQRAICLTCSIAPVFSCQAPTDRTTWQNLVNPILTESMKGGGGLGQDQRFRNGTRQELCSGSAELGQAVVPITLHFRSRGFARDLQLSTYFFHHSPTEGLSLNARIIFERRG